MPPSHMMPIHECPVPQRISNTRCHPCCCCCCCCCCCRRHPGLLPHRPAALFDGADAVPDDGSQDRAAAHDCGRCARMCSGVVLVLRLFPSSLGSCLICWQAVYEQRTGHFWTGQQQAWSRLPMPNPHIDATRRCVLTPAPRPAPACLFLPSPACLQASPACGWRWAGTTTWAWRAGLSPPCLRTSPSHRRTIKSA